MPHWSRISTYDKPDAAITVNATPGDGSITVAYDATDTDRSPWRMDDGSVLPGGGAVGSTTVYIDGAVMNGSDTGPIECDADGQPVLGQETFSNPGDTFHVDPGEHTVTVDAVVCTAQGAKTFTSDPVTVTVG